MNACRSKIGSYNDILDVLEKMEQEEDDPHVGGARAGGGGTRGARSGSVASVKSSSHSLPLNCNRNAIDRDHVNKRNDREPRRASSKMRWVAGVIKWT